MKANTFLNLLKSGSSVVYPLITFPYISRILKPEYIGKINFSISYVSYFSLIASLGVSTYAVRECALKSNDRHEFEKTASQIYTINCISTAISIVLLVLSLIFFTRLHPYLFLVLIYSVNIIMGTIGTEWINTAMEDFRYITLRTFFFQILSIAALFVFVKTPEDYINYALISVMASGGAGLLNIIYRKKYCNIKIIKDTGWKKHLPPILVLFVMSMAQSVFNNADMTMLGIICGDYEVGLYSAAVKITNMISQLLFSILAVLLPRLSYYFDISDFDKVNVLINKAFSFYVVLGFPIIAGVISLSGEIILLIGGYDYAGAVPSLKILTVSFLFSLFGGGLAGNLVLLPSKQEKYFMIVCCITTIINVVLNTFFIPQSGAAGAAAATAVCTFIMMILLLFKTDKRIRINHPLKTVMEPVTGAAAIIIIVTFIKHMNMNLLLTVLLSIGVSVFAYFMILLVFKNKILMEAADQIMKKKY